MKNLIKIAICALALFSMGLSTQNGQLVMNRATYPATSEKTYFVKPTAQGGGDCLSWETACTFITAVSRLSSSYTTTIYLSAGIHDTNSGVTGTTISTSYVRIFGMNNELGNPMTRLVNSHASATHTLNITGSYNSINNVAFGNAGQTATNVIMLRIQASYNDVQRCTFLTGGGVGAETGILIDNSALGVYLFDNQFFSVVTAGVEFGATTDNIMARNQFYAGGKGVYMSSASADRIFIQDTEFVALTTGVDYAAAAAKNLYLIRTYFGGCTNNVAALADYGPTFLESITESGRHSATYPTTVGTECATGNGAWVWTAAATTVIPGDTITKPFRITTINFQDWNVAQTFKLELLYGDGAATVSLGIVEVTLGDPAARSKVDSALPLNVYLPAYSLVGVKVMSSTDGVDHVDITLGYELL